MAYCDGLKKKVVTVFSYNVEADVNRPGKSEDHVELFRASLIENQLLRTHDVINIRGKMRAPCTVDHTTRCKTHDVINIHGKRGLPVPLIIPPDV